MGRLIDADNISFYCNYEGDCTGNIDDCKKCENYICNFRDVQEQPTTYNIDKVVEELEEQKHMIALDGDDADFYKEAINDAIEIVKQGVISDDVCEWIKYDYRTICPKNHDTNNPYWRIPDNTDKLKYCPYCGKKIKVVE